MSTLTVLKHIQTQLRLQLSTVTTELERAVLLDQVLSVGVSIRQLEVTA